MSLVQEYFRLVTEVVDFKVNVYDKDTAEIHNQKVKRMREIATEIEESCPELKNEFCEILTHDNREIRLWVSHHILEVMNCDKAYRKSALREIRHKARTDKTANGFGERVWLKDWYKTHPKDRWI